MKSVWDTEELANHWSLRFEEMQLLKSKPNRNHLAFVSQLKFYQNSGRFPSSAKDISPTVLHYLANQIEADMGYLDHSKVLVSTEPGAVAGHISRRE